MADITTLLSKFLTQLYGSVAAVSGSQVTIAQDAASKVGTAPVGLLVVSDETTAKVGVFSVIGAGVVAEVSDPNAGYTITKDAAGTVNVYYSVDGVYVQNKLAGAIVVRLTLLGA